jgi:23S rRNA (adenine2503-C2)-methyltransferase
MSTAVFIKGSYDVGVRLDLSRADGTQIPVRANLSGLTRASLAEALVRADIATPEKARMRAGQIWRWIHNNGATDFGAMTNIDKATRARLAETFDLARPEIAARQVSADGTRKWLIRFAPGVEAECVYIPDVGRAGALCVSSQVGCTLNCRFCHTGTQALVRNLTAAEIVAQVQIARDDLGEWPSDRADRRLSNIVFMGMGEPLANYRNVVPAMRIFLDDLGYDLSRRRVTLSTSGLVPQIYKLAQECNVALAVSLHAPNDELRNDLVPINRRHPIDELLAACWHYIDAQNGRSVTFEYVMLDGVNDQPGHARQLARLLKGRPAKLNLIPFNVFPGTSYRRSPAATILKFRDILNDHGVIATIRRTRGDDIDAACGQLAGRVTDRTSVRLGAKLAPASRSQAEIR